MKPWLQDNNVKIYLTHNEGKYVVSEKFIRTSNNNIYKYVTAVSKNVYVDKLDGIVNKYIYHNAIKMKPVNVNARIYIDFNKETNNDGPNFKVSDNARISKY